VQRPAAILFDWDNTLIDGWIGIAAALNVVLAAWGKPTWTVAEARQRIRASVRDSFPDLFGPDWRDAARLLRTTMAEQHLNHLALMPGAEAALAAAAPWPGAVVSNKDGSLLRREVSHLGWDARFGALVGAGDASADKPHPAPIWHALGLIGVNPGATVWYVGDTGSDMQAARAAGCTAVLVGDAAHDGGLAALDAANAAPHLHIESASALAVLLGGWTGGET
jgi:phosphoglycolate phosphatase